MSELEDTVEKIAEAANGRGRRVAVAESLTSGRLMAALGRGPETSAWFCGGVLAYRTPVKFSVLGVTPGPVVTARCAEEMARGVAQVLGATFSVAVTGVGGPGPEEGEEEGTVYVGVYADGEVSTTRHELPGEPPEVLDRTLEVALERLLETLVAA